VCSGNLTSLGTGARLSNLKNEGGVIYEALVLHKHAMVRQLAQLVIGSAYKVLNGGWSISGSARSSAFQLRTKGNS